jgi:methionyl-tRNA synthetase
MGKYFLTTAIDYVNSVPHVGTSYEKILADVIARWKRLKGDEVFFLMGNDEHSQQVADKAVELKLEPRAYCDLMEEKFRATWKKLDVSFDRFIRTTEPAHYRACQEIFRRLHAKGDIKKALYKGLYCIGCEARKTEADLENGRCKNHPNTPLKQMDEENYFFLLSKYADRVRTLIDAGQFIDPAFRANEMTGVIDQGLEDISISRRTTRWGVPIPGDAEQVMYVWFDALINYITAAGFPDDMDRFNRLWPADLHVIGKDITRFHAVIWPAMLMGAGIEPPRKLAVHGFVYIGGKKVSKTEAAADPQMAIMRDPIKLADTFGVDTVRYFLLREVAFGQDGEISYEKLTTRHNSDLGDILGNLLNRVVSMTERYLGGVFSTKGAPLPQDALLRETVGGLADRITPLMDRFEFHTALSEVWKAASATNGHIEATAPWKLAKAGKNDEVAGVLYQSAEALRILAVLLAPFMPSTARKIFEQLGIPEVPVRLENARSWDYIRVGTRVQKGPVLFQKIDVKTEQL